MPAPDLVAEAVIGLLTTSLATTLATYETNYGDSVELGTPTYWRAPQGQYPGDLNIVSVAEAADPLSGSNAEQFVGLVEVIAAGQQSHATYTPSAAINKRVWRAATAVKEVVHRAEITSPVGKVYVEDLVFTTPLDGTDWNEQRVVLGLNIITVP